MSQMVVGEVKIKVSFDNGVAKTKTREMNKSLSGLTKTTKDLGMSFQRMGRTISISGFVLGIVSQRVIKSFQGIADSIVKISKEATNLDKASQYLSDTLTALSLSGMLTDDTFNDVIDTFNDMMRVALESAGSWAIIDTAIQGLKTAIAEGALPQLQNLAGFLTGFNMSSFNDALSEATNSFLTPIVEKIKELLGDENGGIEGIRSKLNAIAIIGGTFLAGVLGGMNELAANAANLIGNDAEGVTGLAYWLGEVSGKMLAFAPGAALVGLVISGFGAILSVISGVIGAVGVGGLLALGAIIVTIGSDWDTWSKTTIPNLITALNDLTKALATDLGDALVFVQAMIAATNFVLRSMVEFITDAIKKITQFIQMRNASMATDEELDVGNIVRNEKQGGGRIPRTGNYLMHEGEYVTPRNQTTNNMGGINITVISSNPETAGESVLRAIRTRTPYITL